MPRTDGRPAPRSDSSRPSDQAADGFRNRLTATRDENLRSPHGGVDTTPRLALEVTDEKIVSATDRRTFPRGAPHQLRHCMPTPTRPRPGTRRVGAPGGTTLPLMRTVRVGST